MKFLVVKECLLGETGCENLKCARESSVHCKYAAFDHSDRWGDVWSMFVLEYFIFYYHDPGAGGCNMPTRMRAAVAEVTRR